MQLFHMFQSQDQHRDRERDPASDQRSGGGGWHSFTAMFSDGDRLLSRTPTAASASPIFPSITPALPVPVKDDASSTGLIDINASDEELADLRMEICDINETLRHHDLWVKDAEAMRADVEQLKQSSDGYKVWLENITGLLRFLKAREIELAHQVAALRKQVAQLDIRCSSPHEAQDVSSDAELSRRSPLRATEGSSPEKAQEMWSRMHARSEPTEEQLSPSSVDRVSFQTVKDVELLLRSQLADLETSLKDQLQAEHVEWRREIAALHESMKNLQRCQVCEDLDICEAARAQAVQADDLHRAHEGDPAGSPRSAAESEPRCDLSEEVGIPISGAMDDRGKTRIATLSEASAGNAAGHRLETDIGDSDEVGLEPLCAPD